jgi:hypothetical protein
MESLDAESLCDAVPQKKKRARRQSETEKLSAKGNMHPQELYRRASSHVHMVDEVVFPEPRSRPAPGALADPGGFGNHVAHERPGSRGFLHWRHDGQLPPAETMIDAEGNPTKVFIWTGLFLNVGGRTKFVPGVGTDSIRRNLGELHFWERVRIRFLRKKYGHLENLQRTWHTGNKPLYFLTFCLSCTLFTRPDLQVKRQADALVTGRTSRTRRSSAGADF